MSIREEIVREEGDTRVVVQNENVAFELPYGFRLDGFVLGEHDHSLAHCVALDLFERERNALSSFAMLDVDALALDALDRGRHEGAQRVRPDQDVVAYRYRTRQDDSADDRADERNAETVRYADFEFVIDRETAGRIGRHDVQKRLEQR